MINSFTGDYRFLSNFYPTCVFIDGILYLSAEHAYQALKTSDHDSRLGISLLTYPGSAKRFGRLLPKRAGWENIKIAEMARVLAIKFDEWGPPINDCPEESRLLVRTFPHELIEGNDWHDNFWGDCLCGRDECLAPGENWLGKLLMKRRMELIAAGVVPERKPALSID